MKKIKMFSVIAAALCACVFSGCNLEAEEESYVPVQRTTASLHAETTPPQTTPAATTPATSATSLAADDVIPEAIQTPRVDGDRLLYTIVNVYSGGDYYTVDISGVKLAEGAVEDIDNTYINGELYGDFRLDLLKRGEIIDTLKINVPRDDRFLILESVAENLSYGCELLSNKREFSADEFPDLIQLDFYLQNEAEVPQYARYFAVKEGRLTEVPVLQNGEEAAPYGTHALMESAGVMTQTLVVSTYGGNYTVVKYEYTFDAENMCLNRKQVRYTG